MTMMACQEDLEIGLLRTFLAVARHGTIGRAAAASSATQPAVSQRISRLEKIIGRKLFSRSSGGVQLTAHGELLVAYAHRAIELNEEALGKLREQRASGQVCLGFGAEAVVAQLTPVLKRFQRRHPDVEVRLAVGHPARLESLLAQGELDFFISDCSQTASNAVAIWRSQLAWFFSTEMSLIPPSPLPLVMTPTPDSWHSRILDSLREAGWQWRIVLQGTSMDATVAAIESGLGFAALPREAIRTTGIREVTGGRLPALPESSFGLFRSNKELSRAQVLLELALVSFSKTSKLQRFEPEQVWPLREQPSSYVASS